MNTVDQAEALFDTIQRRVELEGCMMINILSHIGVEFCEQADSELENLSAPVKAWRATTNRPHRGHRGQPARRDSYTGNASMGGNHYA